METNNYHNGLTGQTIWRWYTKRTERMLEIGSMKPRFFCPVCQNLEKTGDIDSKPLNKMTRTNVTKLAESNYGRGPPPSSGRKGKNLEHISKVQTEYFCIRPEKHLKLNG